MALDKAVEHRKERRRPYRDSRRFDPACRHGGGCSYCEQNRTRNGRLVEQRAKQEVAEAGSRALDDCSTRAC